MHTRTDSSASRSKKLTRIAATPQLLGALLTLAGCSGSAPDADLAATSIHRAALTALQGPIRPAKDSGKCLDVRIGSSNNGTPVQIATCYGNQAQNWRYESGQLKVFGNKCLDVPGGRAQNGSKLQIWDCDGNNGNQKWSQRGQTFVWNNRFCLDLENGNTQDLTLVQLWECGSNNSNQQWRPTEVVQPSQPVTTKPPQTVTGATQQPATPQNRPAASTATTPYHASAPGASATVQPAPQNSLSVLDFGAQNDGTGDQTQAIQRAFDAALAQGKTLYFPAGVYNHAQSVRARGINVVGAGTATVLRATSPSSSAVVLTGDNTTLSNLSTQVVANQRSSQPYDCAVLIIGARNAQVLYVNVQGAAANGFRIDGSEGCAISKSLVNGSNADGVALVNGAINNRVTDTQVSNASDDSFSSNSYPGERQNSGNVFERCYAGPNDKQGRSFAMMGSSDETISQCVSVGSLWHGIIAGTDPTSTTQAGFGFTIIGNLVMNNASGSPVLITTDGGMSASSNAAHLAKVQGTRTSGDAASILGWAPITTLPAPASFNSYQGGGPGSNNTPGNRQ